MTTLFIADLHLDPQRPDISRRFVHCLRHQAREAQALYILGDLFEVWVGDDAPLPEYRQCMQALRELTASGVPVSFLPGNRDFLIGRRFAGECGLRLLPDPCVIDIEGRPTALLHGDTLCSDDVGYQCFRHWIRKPWLQNMLLALPAALRWRLARGLRRQSQQGLRDKPAAIMDVNMQTVEQVFAQLGVTRMIHGHTHRPGIHHHRFNGREHERIVLGDWFKQASVLRIDQHGPQLETFD